MCSHWLVVGVGLVFVSLAHPLLTARQQYSAALRQDAAAAAAAAAGMAGEQAAFNSDCPQFCTCVRINVDADRLIAKCDRITATQQFGDRVSVFKLSKDFGSTEDQAITIDDGFFMRLKMKSVQSISISGVTIKSIDVNAFKGLDNLGLVNLTNNNLERIHPDTFATNKNMRQLSVRGNPLSFINKTPYSLNVPYLQELDLSSCQLDNLTASIFSKLSLLTYLNLASNNLNTIASDTFCNLTSLEEINLSNNKIQSLHPDLLIYNEALENLILSNNPLASVENVLLPGVTDLDLSFCQISKISSDSFNGVLGASKLNLSNNAIADISYDAFIKMSRLAYLDLSNNSLHAPLDNEIFVNNNMLETLSLRDNPNMKELPVAGFKGSFSEFFKLNVANCGIETLSPGTLKNLPNLSQLDLSRNSIATFESDGTLPAEIMHLNLAFNKITELNNVHLPEKSQLRKLSVAGNQIKHMQSQFFVNLQHLTTLDLSDCEMEHVWANPQVKIPTLAKMTTINLSGNSLQTITKQDLEAFSNLRLLNIASNPLACDENLKIVLDYLSGSRVEPFGMPSTDGGVETPPPSWEDLLLTLNCWKGEGRVSNNILGGGKSQTDSLQRNAPTHQQSNEYYYDDKYYSSDDYYSDTDNDAAVGDPDHQTPSQDDGTPTNLRTFGLSYQLVAMLGAAVFTFVVIVALLVSVIFCRSRMLLHRESMAKRRGHQLNVYKPLFDHEHLNSPTTPIMKREIMSMPVAVGSEA